MKYELIHDTIARQVFEKASTEARTRRKVERFIRERYEANQLRGAKLTQDDIDYVNPYLAQVNIAATEEAFVEKGRKALRVARRRQRLLVMGAITVLVAFLGIAIWQWNTADVAKEDAIAQQQIAVTQRTKADSIAIIALAREQEAIEAGKKAAESDSLARLQADTARIERDNAKFQTLIAENEKRNAQQQALEAKAVALAAKARQLETTDPTLALNLATAGFHMFSNPETVAALRDILNNHEHSYYSQQVGHAKYTRAIAFSADGERFLTTNFDNVVELWNWEGVVLQSFEGIKEEVTCAAMSPDGKYVLTGDKDWDVKLWNMDGTQVSMPLIGHEAEITSVVFSKDGKYFLSAGEDWFAKLWDLKGNLLRSFWMESSAEKVSFSPDSKQVLVGGHRSTKQWNLETGDSLVIEYENEYATLIHDGTAILTHSGLRDLTGAYLQKLNKKASRIAISPDGQLIAAAYGNTVSIFDRKGQVWKRLIGHRGAIVAITFSGDGNSLMTGSTDNTTKSWPINREQSVVLKGHSSGVWSASFSPDGKTILTGSSDSTVMLWNLQGKIIRRFQTPGQVRAVAFSPDGKHFLTGETDKTAKLWNVQGGEPKVLSGHTTRLTDVAFSPNGKYILTGGDLTAKLWSREGKEVSIKTGYDGLVLGGNPIISALAFSPNDNQFVTASYGHGMKLWSLGGKEILHVDAAGGWMTDVAFSPDGKLILTGSINKTLVLSDLTGKDKLRINTGGVINSVAFSPDGAYFVVGFRDAIARLYTIGGQELFRFTGHQKGLLSSIYSVSFSPDGKLIMTACGDKTTRLWRNPTYLDPQLYHLNEEERSAYAIPHDLKY